MSEGHDPTTAYANESWYPRGSDPKFQGGRGREMDNGLDGALLPWKN